MQSNWFLGSLVAGLLSSSIAILLSLLPMKGVVLMSVFVVTLALAVCGEFRMPVEYSSSGANPETLPSNMGGFFHFSNSTGLAADAG